MTFVLGMRAEFDPSSAVRGAQATEDALQDVAGAAKSAGAAMDAALQQQTRVSRQAAAQLRNVQFQMIDIGQSFPLAFQSPVYFLQNVAMQGAQIAQIYGPNEGGAARGFREAAKMATGFVRSLLPLAGVIGAGAAAWLLFSRNTSEASAEVRRLAADASSFSAVQGMMADLARVQKAYRDAIEDTANAQLIASSGIVAATEREFEAKKSLLELELKRQQALVETQRIAVAEEQRSLRKQLQEIVDTSDISPRARGFADPRIGSVPFVRDPDAASTVEALLTNIDASPASDRIKQLRAELELTEVSAELLEKALKTTFNDIGSGKVDKHKTTSAERYLQGYRRSQAEELAQLRLEAELIGATAVQRERANALLETELAIKRSKIAVDGALANAMREQAVALADQTVELRRQADAYGTVKDAGLSMIDSIWARLKTGDVTGLLADFTDEIFESLGQLNVVNPLKNALYGENLGTMSDVNGLGGFFSTLLGRNKPSGEGIASAISQVTGTMNVQAATVIVSGGITGTAGGAGGIISSLFGGSGSTDPWAGLRFDTGGWTGGSDPSRVAGYVHEKEFVVRAGPAARFRPMLEAINAGRNPGHADGGMVTGGIASASYGASGAAMAAPGMRPLNVSFDVHDNAGVAIEQRQETDADGDVMFTLVLNKVDAAIADGRFDSSFGGRYRGAKVRGTAR
ncbi:hypothetical protein [Oricola sp.]|uniref:hypothetical protein n=1 Tax=Oricola sp. TaxID=1979950 RepID=UPI0025E36AEB|nr:hypothetical protein [Oricola sp.]MCI5075547.1 hypothetical protein [Oricola sp.]